MVRKQVKALTVLYLVPYQHFGVDFAPYQILLVMGAIASATMIIPGVSGSMVLMLLG